MAGEIGYNRLISVTNNAPLDPSTTRGAWGARVTFEPAYFQVLPRVDLTVPISVGYAFGGRSALGPTIFGPENGGDLSIGLSADWARSVKIALQYTNFFGPKGSLTLDPVLREYSYRQFFEDRDYVSLTVKTTF